MFGETPKISASPKDMLGDARNRCHIGVLLEVYRHVQGFYLGDLGMAC